MTPSSPLGDALPPALAAYWLALDAGRFGDAAACFSRDAVYAVPFPRDVETAPRDVTTGSAALLARFLERGRRPLRHVPLLCVADGPDTLVEGTLCDLTGRSVATFVCSARTGADGLIVRFLAFACAGAVDPVPTDVDEGIVPADASAVVHDYFADLDGGRFPAAAARFSADVLYSHPPYQHTGINDPGRIEFRGRPALLAAFDRRGEAGFDHLVMTSIQRGPHCMFEGAVRGLPGGETGSFISSLSLAGDGTIRRYVSFYCEPGIPRRA
jgi:hypothetical protein